MRKSSNFPTPPPAISLVPDSVGHKSKRNEKNSCGFCTPLCHYLALPDSVGHKSKCIMRTTAVVSAPRFATISLVSDAEGHKPKRNEKNSYGVTQQHKKLLFNPPVLSII